jgi:SAM-dependent methyltransferase
LTAEAHKRAEIASRSPEFMAAEASKPFGWSPLHFIQWATVEAMIETVGLRENATILDVGCGSGWTSLFLAEAGYKVTGYDLVPANIELSRMRAKRWTSSARFEVADMEQLPPGDPADAALLLDALHHTAEQRATLQAIGRRLRPGGWLLLGEPTWLHRFSPEARAVERERGWLERGLSFRELRHDLRDAGFGEVRRFFQPTRPYERRALGCLRQLVQLVSANILVAPQSLLWVAAQRVPTSRSAP